MSTKPESDYILDHKGAHISLLDPASTPLEVATIARSLSRLPRYTSHTLGYFTYSIGQHSLGASYQVPWVFALEALLHDASEAYLNDLSSPVKRLCPDYRKLERRFDDAIRVRFGLPAVMSPCVKHADLVMLATEKRDLMAHDQTPWGVIHGIMPTARKVRPHWSWKWTEYLFLKRYEELTGERVT